jgi:hypothetical protein
MACIEQRFRQFLDPDPALFDRLAILLAQAELLHRHCGADQPADYAGRCKPIDGHAADQHDERKVAFLLSNQFAN